MILPANTDALADSFTKLPAERKAQIVQHLRATSGQRAQATVAELIRQGGVEGEFVVHLFGKDVPDPGASPQNKKINPPMAH